MPFFILALIVSVIGVLPLAVAGKLRAAAIVTPFATAVTWGIFYRFPPDLVNPFWGGLGFITALYSALSAGAVIMDGQDRKPQLSGSWPQPKMGRQSKVKYVLPASLPTVIVVCLLVRWIGSTPMFRSADYAAMLGEVQSRVWTQDVQPKDPQHVRKVPEAYASWVANKQLGAADSALGSQYELDTEHMTVQMVRGEIWFVVPLKFKDWGTWRAKETAPGFIMVSAEDPNREAVSVFDRQYAYMPSAYFGNELARHLWTHGYSDKRLSDFTFEVDEENRGWWVVTVTHPTVGWSADRVDGVVIVNPTDGSFTYRALGDVPKWVDRVMPASLMESYMAWRGEYAAGWLNSWFSEVNLTQPEDLTFVHGSDDEPYFVADITSINDKDDALLGLMYVNARDGRTTYYKAKGVTSRAALQAVNAKISYKKWSGQSPVLYNMYGTMADIIPLIAENSTYQGVAIVNIAKPQDVAIGTDMTEALREYQKLLSVGSDPAPELAMKTRTLTGIVLRFSRDDGDHGSVYYVLLKDGKTIFTSGGELSPKLPLTREGDTVTLTYVDSGEAVEPLLSFDNSSIRLDGVMPKRAAPDKR